MNETEQYISLLPFSFSWFSLRKYIIQSTKHEVSWNKKLSNITSVTANKSCYIQMLDFFEQTGGIFFKIEGRPYFVTYIFKEKDKINPVFTI